MVDECGNMGSGLIFSLQTDVSCESLEALDICLLVEMRVGGRGKKG